MSLVGLDDHQQWVSWSSPKGLKKPGRTWVPFFFVLFGISPNHWAFFPCWTNSLDGWFLFKGWKEEGWHGVQLFVFAGRWSGLFGMMVSVKNANWFYFPNWFAYFLAIEYVVPPIPIQIPQIRQSQVHRYVLDHSLYHLLWDLYFCLQWCGALSFFGGICCCNWNMQMDMVTFFIFFR